MIKFLQKKVFLLLSAVFTFNVYTSEVSQSKFVEKMRKAVDVTNATPSKLAQKMRQDIDCGHDSESLNQRPNVTSSNSCSHVSFIQSIKATRAPRELPCRLEKNGELSPLDLPMSVTRENDLPPFSLLD